MKNIAVCTFARSEYGLLKQVLVHAVNHFNTKIIAGSGHLKKGLGITLDEISSDAIVNKDDLLIADSPPNLTSAKTIADSISKGVSAVAKLLDENKFDAAVFMGDRYELFTVAISAMLKKIPLVHISGGEITEGAFDDNIRHAITKMSHLHLVANSECAMNVSCMGEEDWRIVISGEPGLDNIHNEEIASAEEIKSLFGLDTETPLILVTMHPSTMEPDVTLETQYQPLLNVLEALDNYTIIITAPGAEEGAMQMIKAYKSSAEKYDHIRYIPHLGRRNYLSVLRSAVAVVGNSSSGIVEAPSLGIPTVNIGGRQKKRMASETVINCGYNKDEIVKAIDLASSEQHKSKCKNSLNPYDPYCDGNNSLRVITAIKHFLEKIDRSKQIVKCFDTNIKSDQWNSLLK